MLQTGPCRSEWPSLLPNAMVTCGPELRLRAMSESMALLQPGSVLMSKAPVTIDGHTDGQGLEPCWCPRAMLPLGMCQSEWPVLPPGAVVTSRPSCCQRPCLGLFIVLPQLWSVLKSESCIATKGCTEARGWDSNLKPWWCLGARLPPEPP